MTYEAGNERPANSGQGRGQGQERQIPPVPPVQTPGQGSGERGPGPGADGMGPDRTDMDRTGVPGGSAGGERHAGPTAHRPGRGAQLLPHGERDKLGMRLQQAVNHFVDEPRRAVEEADHVLEETVRHIAETLAEHRRSLRGAWESEGREAQTEELRVALRKYREVTERLLQM